MDIPANQPPAYHVLLIGIDAYPTMPLHGCVNDIDAVQRTLLRAGVPLASIKRLASPHPGTVHEPTPAVAPATLANLRAAFAALAAPAVARQDRVFIYYSGHGTRLRVAAGNHTFHREALVPVDFDAQPGGQLLFDFEINQLLAKIAARTTAVTFILDCCNSAGATRQLPGAGMIPRFLDVAQHLGMHQPLPLPPAQALLVTGGARGIAEGVAGSVDACQVVAACLNHELAHECVGPDGIQQGLLTRALVTALGPVADGALASLPWGRVWQRMRADVETRNPSQHLWMAGSYARAVLAGPPVDGDVGFAVARTDRAYAVDAGVLASVTEGALLAVYGDEPFKLPPLDSAEDLAARASPVLLRITRAERATSVAEADGAPFALPPGARARLVKPGASERLRCAVLPADADVARALGASPLLQVVGANDAQVRLERGAGGAWSVTDDLHGAKPGYPVLFTLRAAQIDRAREVLEHYFHYVLPVRLVTRCTDLAGALQLALLACPADRDLTAEEAQAAKLPEVPTQSELDYELTTGERFCVRVRNTSRERLRVTLVNSAASGRVEVLGDQLIDADGFHVFWMASNLGSPFAVWLPPGAQGIDRLVAVGTTALGKSLAYLGLDATFADVAARTRGELRGTIRPPAAPSAQRWTATQVTVRSRAR